jgi:hypothetical protein
MVKVIQLLIQDLDRNFKVNSKKIHNALSWHFRVFFIYSVVYLIVLYSTEDNKLNISSTFKMDQISPTL